MHGACTEGALSPGDSGGRVGENCYIVVVVVVAISGRTEGNGHKLPCIVYC